MVKHIIIYCIYLFLGGEMSKGELALESIRTTYRKKIVEIVKISKYNIL